MSRATGKGRQGAGRTVLTVFFLLLVAVFGYLLFKEISYKHDEKETDELEQITDYKAVITAEEIPQLDRFKNLETLDLTGSTCYDEIDAYIASHPEVNVIYSVDLGGTVADHNARVLDISSGAYDYNILVSAADNLPYVMSVNLGATELTADQIDTLKTLLPKADFSYSVSLMGKSYPTDSTEIDLRGVTAADLDKAVNAVRMLPELSNINIKGSPLTIEEVGRITEACPDALVDYDVTLFGQTFSMTDEIVEYRNVDIGDSGLEQFRKVLPLMKHTRKLLLENCGTSDEAVDALRAEFLPTTEVVWKVRLGGNELYTDCPTIWINGLNDETAYNLRYFYNCKHMDIGESTISDLSFLEHMPNLDILIVACGNISDITPIGSLKNLWYLETFDQHVMTLTDISALSNCTKLEHLNCTGNQISDLSPLDNLPLKRMYLMNDYALSEEGREEFEKKHPDCECNFICSWQASGATGGWRVSDYGVSSEVYLDLCRIFYGHYGRVSNRSPDFDESYVHPDPVTIYKGDLT